MTRDSQPLPPLFHVSVPGGTDLPAAPRGEADAELKGLMRQMLANQERQNLLLEQMVDQLGLAQRQRAKELKRWKTANPHLARDCRHAAESLTKVQTEFLQAIADEVNAHEETLVDSSYAMTEFVDRFGPRLAQLNGVLQVLSQLGYTEPNANT